MRLLIKSFYLLTLSFVIAGFSTSISASELTDPKANGLIGERYDGYIGIVKDAPANVKALVKTVNAKRKVKYKEIAKKRQEPLGKVELIAGAAAIKKTKTGNYIMKKGEGWTKK